MAQQNDLPSDFTDIVSARLLIAPKPQFLYASMWKTAQAVSMGGVPDLPFLKDAGAPYTSADRDRLMLSDPLATTLVATPVNNMSGLPGSTLRFNRPVYTATTYTEASRRVASGASITTTPISVGQNQVPLTLYRFAGPYDTANSRPAPLPIEAFDAQLGLHKQVSLVESHINYDFDRFIESVNVALMDSASVTVRPQGMTADTTATAAGMFPMTYWTLCRAERLADDANIPVFGDGFRMAVLHPVQVQQLKNDPQYARYATPFPQYNALHPNYVTSINRTHIFRSTLLTTTANASSVNVFTGHYMGPGALMGGHGRMPRVAASSENNYQETFKLVWIADLAFGLADNTFCLKINTAGDAS